MGYDAHRRLLYGLEHNIIGGRAFRRGAATTGAGAACTTGRCRPGLNFLGQFEDVHLCGRCGAQACGRRGSSGRL